MTALLSTMTVTKTSDTRVWVVEAFHGGSVLGARVPRAKDFNIDPAWVSMAIIYLSRGSQMVSKWHFRNRLLYASLMMIPKETEHTTQDRLCQHHAMLDQAISSS